MSKQQLNRFNIISLTLAGHLKIKEAADQMELSERQVMRPLIKPIVRK
ncbi:hypothetical protein [Anoxynatronum buryatiense]|uniref:Uncharacterized protein n=1 Tax=Anoxynatronum sibiricum TaxID=210623 RepID=A0ABU9VZD0_9CLOT|nr:hypothetical protein [Anoxynatronum buryatiense]